MANKNNLYSLKADVIILMAGEGRRMLPLTKNRPKALIYFNNITIFEHIVRAFVSQSVIDVSVFPVIGHGRINVLKEAAKLKELAKIICVTNPFYSSAGPLVSFWLGLSRSLNDNVVLLNGDTIITRQLVSNIHKWFRSKGDEMRAEVGICVSNTKNLNQDDMKILLNQDRSIARVGKDIPLSQNTVKSAGVLCLKNYYTKKLLMDRLDAMLMDEEPLGKKYYWHNILNEISATVKIDLISVDEDSWHEIDTEFDLSLLS